MIVTNIKIQTSAVDMFLLQGALPNRHARAEQLSKW